MRQICFLIAALCLGSCTSGTQKKEVERVADQKYTVVSDSIYSRMPGSMFYQDGILYWHYVFSPEGFIHAIETGTRRELCSFGAMGDGPEEFSVPLLSLSPASGFLVNDGSKKLEVLYQVHKETGSLSVSAREYENRQDAVRFLYLANGDKVYLCPNASRPFYVKPNLGEGKYEGSFPINEKIANGFDLFQGQLVYNPVKEVMVYSAFSFPYMAVYKTGKGNIKMDAELKPSVGYTLTEGELHLDPSEEKGAMELGLTKDYVVTLQRDRQVEGEAPQPRHARDTSTLPHSLFVYDYELNLTRIIHMPFPMLRLCGDAQTNSIYAVAVNPEFMIIKIDLE